MWFWTGQTEREEQVGCKVLFKKEQQYRFKSSGDSQLGAGLQPEGPPRQSADPPAPGCSKQPDCCSLGAQAAATQAKLSPRIFPRTALHLFLAPRQPSFSRLLRTAALASRQTEA